MIKLVESVRILLRFTRETANRMNLIIDFGFGKRGFNDLSELELTHLNSLFYMTVIDAVSYLDEYDQIFGHKTELEFVDRIRVVKSINKPLINRIKEWKDIKELRNQLMAHNLRSGKNGNFIFSIDNLDYNAPKTINDLFLLSNLIQFSTQTIYSEFISEIKSDTTSYSKKIRSINKILSKDDVSKITTELLMQSNKIKRELSRNYEFTVHKLVNWDAI